MPPNLNHGCLAAIFFVFCFWLILWVTIFHHPA